MQLVVGTDNLLLYGVNLVDAFVEGFGNEFIANEMFCYHKAKITEHTEVGKDREKLGSREQPYKDKAGCKNMQGYRETDILRLVAGRP